MFEWIKRNSAPLSLKCTLAFGSLNAGSNWHKRSRITNGHEIKQKRLKRASNKFVNAPTQGNGYQDTAGFKYTSTCNIINNRKVFYGNNIQMVKKLAENHYRLILKLAVLEASPQTVKIPSL